MRSQHDWGRQARELAEFDREVIVSRLLAYRSRPRLDFSPEYLSNLTTEQLRHLLMAAMMTGSRN